MLGDVKLKVSKKQFLWVQKVLPFFKFCVFAAALPEIIGNNCENCNRAQFNNVNRVARFVETRYPNLWAAIVQKYSQQGQEQPGQAQVQDTPDQFYNIAPAI